MLNEIKKMTTDVSVLEDPRDHDRAVESMRDEKLSDGCAAQDYADLVNELITEHVGHLERPLEGTALGKFIILLMPEKNSSEGRSLLRELTFAGQLSNSTMVINKRCD